MWMTKILRPDMYSRPYRSVTFIICTLGQEQIQFMKHYASFLVFKEHYTIDEVLHLIESQDGSGNGQLSP
jgi:hypothetical protein